MACSPLKVYTHSYELSCADICIYRVSQEERAKLRESVPYVTLMLSTDINITETTYSCQFQYEFGNQ